MDMVQVCEYSLEELIDEMTRQGYPGNRKTIKNDIDVLNKFGMKSVIDKFGENIKT